VLPASVVKVPVSSGPAAQGHIGGAFALDRDVAGCAHRVHRERTLLTKVAGSELVTLSRTAAGRDRGSIPQREIGDRVQALKMLPVAAPSSRRPRPTVLCPAAVRGPTDPMRCPERLLPVTTAQPESNTGAGVEALMSRCWSRLRDERAARPISP